MALIAHLSPQLPPAICGVGDYSARVGRQMEQEFPELRCGYITCHLPPDGLPTGEGGRRVLAGAETADGLWKAVDELVDEFAGAAGDRVSLVVHYSGYGYDHNGAPAWLARALERRPRRLATVRVVGMFHELYATGWPWQRAFWFSRAQHNTARRVALACDAALTNREESARWLERARGKPAGSVASFPVPSNLGEPDEIVAWRDRAARGILFGGPRFKKVFLAGRGRRQTIAVCRKLGIRELVDIGLRAHCDERPFREAGIDVKHTGFLSASEAGEHLRTARLQFVDYFPGYFAKSSVLAAAAAYGVPPILPRSDGASDGLRFGDHMLDLSSLAGATPEEASRRLSAVSVSIRDWYDGHCMERHAWCLHQLCCPGAVAVS